MLLKRSKMHILCKKISLNIPNMFMIAKNAVNRCKHAVDAGSQLAFETQPMCQVVFVMIQICKKLYLTTNNSAYANIDNLSFIMFLLIYTFKLLGVAFLSVALWAWSEKVSEAHLFTYT